MKLRALMLPLLAGGMVTCVLAGSARAQQPVATTATTASAAPAASAEAPLISIDEVRQRMNAGQKILFVDARGAISGDMVKGAAHVPVADVDAWARDVAKDAVIVTYCACPTDGGAKAAANRLAALGYAKAFALHGGIGAWKSAGLPTEAAPTEPK